MLFDHFKDRLKQDISFYLQNASPISFENALTKVCQIIIYYFHARFSTSILPISLQQPTTYTNIMITLPVLSEHSTWQIRLSHHLTNTAVLLPLPCSSPRPRPQPRCTVTGVIFMNHVGFNMPNYTNANLMPVHTTHTTQRLTILPITVFGAYHQQTYNRQSWRLTTAPLTGKRACLPHWWDIATSSFNVLPLVKVKHILFAVAATNHAYSHTPFLRLAPPRLPAEYCP